VPARTFIFARLALAATALADTGFLVGLLSANDRHHDWAVAVAVRFPTPWHSCESVLAEAFHLVEQRGRKQLAGLLERRAVVLSFALAAELKPVLSLMAKYHDVPMNLADACLVRMTELVPDPVIITSDSDFAIYRRNGRQVIPRITPA
jgi:uncharacterized protein